LRPYAGLKSAIAAAVPNACGSGSAIVTEDRTVKAISSDCCEGFNYHYGGCDAHDCGALMQFIKERLWQDDARVSPAKANFQLRTPDSWAGLAGSPRGPIYIFWQSPACESVPMICWLWPIAAARGNA